MYIVMIVNAKMPQRCPYPYERCGVVELEEGFTGTPKMLSERAKGVKRVVAEFGPYPARFQTERATGAQCLKAATELCDHLNFLEINKRRRRGKKWLATLRERIENVENVEIQRELLEWYGFEEYLADSGAIMTHQDETGKLYIRETAAGTIAAVAVECPSTGRKYMLRVPPRMTTARAAVAWTFGLTADQYQPRSES